MEHSSMVGNDNYNEIIGRLVSNYMQMLDAVDFPMQQVEKGWYRHSAEDSKFKEN